MFTIHKSKISKPLINVKAFPKHVETSTYVNVL